jgi:alternate signal-mediated exported protein
MNKLIKGSVAAATGIVLLMGGAGSLALWNDTQAVNGGTVSTGELDIALTGTGAWKDISSDAPNTTWATTDKLVPGDTITYTQDVAVKASGKNIKATLAYTAGSVVIPAALYGPDNLPNTADDYVTVAIGVTAANAADNATITGTGPYTLTSATDGTVEYRVVITIAFKSSTPGQVGQNVAAGINVSGASFTLTQVRPS